MKFEGRVALVTGGGSGMGRAMVEEFVTEGAVVIAVDIDEQAANDTVERLATPDRASTRVADISSPNSVEALVADLLNVHGKIDIVCNNAGVLDDYTPAHETSVELWNRVIGVNLTGAFLVSRAVVPVMLEQSKGVIINTASISAFVAGGGGAAYTASKHGLLGLTKQIAFDYGSRGIRANAICPGAVHTGMTEHLLTSEGRNQHVDSAIARTPAGRWGKPIEIAKLAAFLASDDADFIHGAGYLIDGGWTLP